MNKFSTCAAVALLLFSLPVFSQSPYRLNLKVDIPIIAVGGALTAYGFHRIESKSPSDTATILALDKSDLIPLNRPATKNYSPQSDKNSDYFFYGGFAYPFLLLLDKEIRQDAATIGTLYLETMAITGTNYAFTASLVDKYRPYAYNPETPMGKRLRHGAKNSFPGGHPSVTAAATVFAAKVFTDYHPESGFRYVLYATSLIATGANVYFRYKGGFHFPTDLAIGVAAGALTGYLVPYFHKKRDRAMGFRLHPYVNGESTGLCFRMGIP